MTGSAVSSDKARTDGRPRAAERPDGPRGPASLLASVGSALTNIGRSVAGVLRGARSRWRSSLRLRVVSTTLVVSAIVVSLLGFFLMQQITTNFLRKAEAEAKTQALDGVNIAQSLPGAMAVPQASTAEDIMHNIASNLKSSGQNPADEYGVAVGVPDLYPPVYLKFSSNKLPTQYLP
jgi:two-component system sensor histidine kinase MtrB